MIDECYVCGEKGTPENELLDSDVYADILTHEDCEKILKKHDVIAQIEDECKEKNISIHDWYDNLINQIKNSYLNQIKVLEKQIEDLKK